MPRALGCLGGDTKRDPEGAIPATSTENPLLPVPVVLCLKVSYHDQPKTKKAAYEGRGEGGDRKSC